MSKKKLIQAALLCVGLPFLTFLVYNIGIFVFTGSKLPNMADRVFASAMITFVTLFAFGAVTVEMRD